MHDFDHSREDAGPFTKTCHKCPTAAAIAAGKHTSTPWAKMPCSRCRLSEHPNHKGRSHVSIDNSYGNDGATPEPGDGNPPPEAIDIEEREQEEAVEPSSEADAMSTEREELMAGFRRLCRDLFEMGPRTREIVLAAVGNPERPLTDIGKELGIGKSAVHDRMDVAIRSYPWVAEAIGRPHKAKAATP